MALILNIETTTRNCSVSLFLGEKLISNRSHISSQYSHSELLTTFIQEVIDLTSFSLTDLDAVSVSKGPGSYTGLRIGVSTAKGLCYALSIPLLSVCPLRCMSFYISNKYPDYDLYCPMIDARRMEVFSALFDKSNNEIRGVQADIVNKETYSNFLNNKVLFFGDGAIKCKEMINHKNATFVEGIYPSAKNLGFLAQTKFLNKDFEDIAYFEPYYLKDFLVGKKSV